MKILYIDEAGGFEAPDSSPSATPLMVVAGVAFDHSRLPAITDEFLKLKARFYPGKVVAARHLLDYVLAEVKGSDVRAAVRSSSRDQRRQAIGFLDHTMALLASHGAAIVGRVWVKAHRQSLSPRASYTFAIQDLALHFEHLLASSSDTGLMVCDGRMHHQDAEVAHSIFTQKHKLAGDSYPHLVEATLFGRSQNHVGLQLADLVASALLFPMATRTFCPTLPTGPHTSARFDTIKQRYASTLRSMQHRYQDGAGRWRGGVVVSDKLGHRPSKRTVLADRIPGDNRSQPSGAAECLSVREVGRTEGRAAGMMKIVLREGYNDMFGDIADADLAALIECTADFLIDAAAGRR